MKKSFSFLLLVFALCLLQAQGDCKEGRYYMPIFPDVSVTSAVEYGFNANPTILNPGATQKLYMDVYQPVGDTLSQRPVIMLAFGGAFVFGARTSPDIVHLCREFAKLGYVSVAIDYRLTSDLVSKGSQRLATLAVLKASHDMRAALRFMYKDAATANTYSIDTSRIYIGGVSAGSLAALHTAYLDKLHEIPPILASDTAGLGGIPGLSGNAGYSSRVAGVINLCGALGETSFIEANDPILVSMHGTKDGTVPYGRDTVTLFNLNLPVSGSAAIHAHLDTANLQLKHAFYSWQGAGHTPFLSFITVEPKYMDTTFRFVRDFLYEEICGNAVAIDPIQQRASVQAYPNPAENELFFRIKGISSPDLRISMTNALGKTILFSTEKTGNILKINTQSMTPGLYIWHISDAKGQYAESGKVILK